MLWSLGRGLFPLLKLRLTIVVKSIYEFSHIAHNLLPLQKVFGTVPFPFFFGRCTVAATFIKDENRQIYFFTVFVEWGQVLNRLNVLLITYRWRLSEQI